MSSVNQFRSELEKSLAMLGEDEWAVARARDDFAESLESTEAFLAIMDILNLAKEQEDSYALDTCCTLALQLAGKAQTTECPKGLEEKLKELIEYSNKFGEYSINEVKKVASWFRLSNIT